MQQHPNLCQDICQLKCRWNLKTNVGTGQNNPESESWNSLDGLCTIFCKQTWLFHSEFIYKISIRHVSELHFPSHCENGLSINNGTKYFSRKYLETKQWHKT